jgi:sugar lactone lactonase YvrE
VRHRRTAQLCATILASLVTAAAPAYASTAPLDDVRQIAHFDVTALQQPENITLEPGGAADVTFNRARQVARIGKDGSVTILATLPASTTGTAMVSGLVRAGDGTLYVNYNAGRQSGIWRIAPEGGAAEQIVALPEVKFLNGLALDRGQDALYVTDSTSGAVWKVSLGSRTASVWAQGAEFQPNAVKGSGFGANGIKVHDGVVWVSNTDKGTLLSIPIGRHGAAGSVRTSAQGLTAIDDFAFTGQGDTVLAAQNFISQASIVHSDGTHETVLTSSDGLSNPTSVAVRGNTAYVASAAYFTHLSPNLLSAKLR